MDDKCEVIISTNRLKEKHRRKRKRDVKYKNHLKYIADHVPPRHGIKYMYRKYIYGIGYITYKKPYYKRYYRSHNGGSKKRKIYSNRRFRHYTGEVASRGAYKKYFNY